MSVLRRIEGSRFSEVLPAWAGRAVVIIGGGSSLTREQVDLVRRAHAGGTVQCIAVNDAYLWAPFADLHYAADSHWHKWHTDGIDKALIGLTAARVREAWAAFAGQKCTIQHTGYKVTDEVHILLNRDHPYHGMGLSRDPRFLVTGRNSGFQALNLAILAGASVLILLGFDGHPGKEHAHFHGAHPRPTPPQAYEEYRRAFSAAEHAITDAGVTVLNCTPGTAIDSFEKVELSAALERVTRELGEIA